MMLDYTVLFSLLALACSGGIVSEGDLSVALGQSASFSCSLARTTGLKQVMWQHRDAGESVHTVATFSDSLRQPVEERYAGKVELAVAALNDTTVVIKNVTFADEGCYTCTFYVYPSGTERQTSCLSVHGLTEMTTSKALPDPTEKKVAWCRATGKPAPVVRWMCEDREIKASSDNSTSNEDSTVTTTSYLASLPAECSERIVECVAESGDVKLREHLWDDEKLNSTENVSRRYLASCFAAVICMLIVIVICIAIVLHRWRKPKSEKESKSTSA